MNIGSLFVSLQADAKPLKSGVQEASSALDGLGSAAKKLGGVLAGVFAAREVFQFGSATISTFAEADQVWNRLGGTLNTVGVSMAGVRGEIDRAARAMQDVTTVGDEDFAQVLGTLTRISGDYAASMRNVSVVADLAAGAQIDLSTAAQLVGKAMVGNTAARGKMGIVVKEGENAVDSIAKRFRGMAENEARSFTGQIVQVNNEWGDFKEAIGGALVSMGEGVNVIGTVRDGLKSMTAWVTENAEAFRTLGSAVVDFGGWVVRDIAATIRQLAALFELVERIKNAMPQASGFAAGLANSGPAGGVASAAIAGWRLLTQEAKTYKAVVAGTSTTAAKALQPLMLEGITVVAKAADTTSKAIKSSVKATTEQVRTWFDEQRELLARPITPQMRLDAAGMAGGVPEVPAVLTEAVTGFGRLTVAMNATEAATVRAGMVWEGAGQQAGDDLSFLGSSAQSLLSGFTPLGMLTTVLSGAFSAMAPVLQALQIPLRVLGEIIGSVVIKPLQLLARALGFLIRGIGKLVDKIPGVSGGPLIRAGQEMIDASHGMAGAMGAAADSAQKLTQSLQSVPPVFDYLLRRREAAVGGGMAGAPSVPGGRPPITINGGVAVVAAPGEDPRELWRRIERVIVEESRRGGTSELNYALGMA